MDHAENPTPEQRPANAIVHGECGRWWTGPTRAHCPACHQVFSGESAAEHHRVGTFGAGGTRKCADPAAVGLVARARPYGVLWGWPSAEGYDLASRGGAA